MLWSFFLSSLALSLVIAISLTQPAALGWLLLAIAGLIILYYYLLGFYWGSLALFIVFVGGLLVAFRFISATASNWTLIEYYSFLWWLNILIALVSLALIFTSFGLPSFSAQGLITSISSVVDRYVVVIFWLCIAALLLVLFAGVKMCISFSRPLHWLK